MGEGTYVTRSNTSNAKHSSRAARSINLPFDVPLLLIVIVLLVFGLLMVYSASWDFSMMVMNRPPTYMFNRQVLWVLLGLLCATVASFINYHRYEKYVFWFWGITLVLLIAILVTSHRGGPDVTRMLLGSSIQPSELAKAVIIIYLSFWLYNRQETINHKQIALIPLAFILGVTFATIMAQPDLSAGFTVIILGVMLFFMAGGDWKIILLMIIFILVFGSPFLLFYETGRLRITSYIIAINNPLASTTHLQRSLEAVIRGGWFGVGLGQANTKFTGLPLAPTDSIFAVVAEETGVLGGLFLVILYSLLVWRGIVIAKKAPDQLGSLLAFGITGWIGFEAMLNMATMLGLLPFVGNTLPLISAGGSSMVVKLTTLGIVMNVSRTSMNNKSKNVQNSERSPRSAVVDLRRRDGRGSVPRHHRS